METLECIAKRTSVREYAAKPVPKQILEKLIDAGRRAPSARAVEPWEFVVVTEKEMLTKLSQIATTGAFLKGAAACIAVFCLDTKYYLEDGCAATENILLAACDLGLGACWIAGDKKPYEHEIVHILGLPLNVKLVSLLSLGWPLHKAEQKKIRPLSQVLHWEKFQGGHVP
jgi:nitroreductase